MASVKKIRRARADGTVLQRWQLRCYDRNGERHTRNFDTKAEANAERDRIAIELRSGAHVPERHSPTVKTVLDAWTDHVEALVAAGKRERSTLVAYRQHVDLHIATRSIATLKLARLTTPAVQEFVDAIERELSTAMARRVLGSLRMGLTFARRRGWITTNPAEAAQGPADSARDREAMEIPTKAEIAAILAAADVHDTTGYAAAFLRLGFFAGLRMSELRGLARPALQLKAPAAITISQRADRWGTIGAPKSARSRRKVPIGPQTAAALRTWLKSAPTSTDHLVFPTGAGAVEGYSNIYHRVWCPILVAAGVTRPAEGEKGEAGEVRARYGPHVMRHVAASLWIEQGLTQKQVQHRLGHATLQMTMDLYGHLWSDPEQDAAMAEAMENTIGTPGAHPVPTKPREAAENHAKPRKTATKRKSPARPAKAGPSGV